MSIKKGDACPNENDPRWSILLSTVNNDKQDAVEAWTRNDYEFPEGWKLQSTKGWYEEARELRKKSVDELAEFIVSHTKESFSQKKISNSYWMKEFGDLGRATQKINKVNLQVRKELFKLHPIEGKYHKKSGNQMRILKTTDGRSIFKQVDYTLKPVDTLMSDRAVQMFSKAQKVGWTLDKTLNELGGFANYKQLFKQDQLNDKISDNTREQIITELASNYSYTVEINTAKRGGSSETPEWMDEDLPIINSDFYSNLTVPGGTNYTENEISTPLITPSIKGHAAFSTDKGIGWFRSDEQVINGNYKEIDNSQYDEVSETYQVDINKITEGGTSTKTRRILEVQSDIFQKSRDIKSPDEIINELKKSGKLQIKCD